MVNPKGRFFLSFVLIELAMLEIIFQGDVNMLVKPEEQLRIIMKGVHEVVNEEELLAKVNYSHHLPPLWVA